MRLVLALLAGLFLLPLVPASGLAQDGYRIRSGDMLRFEVLEDPGLNRSALVSPDGRISLPLAGVVPVSGRSVEQVQTDLAARIASNFAVAPTVYVAVERIGDRPAAGPAARSTIDIYVMGEVAKPGKLSVERGTTMLQLFAEMGGFSKFAATKRIQLRRTDRRTGVETLYGFDYKAIERGESQSGNTVLTQGDVILVPQRRLFE